VNASRAATLVEMKCVRAGYGSVEVVHGVDLDVAPGEVVALIGPNGAGKSTTLVTIAGLIPHLGGDLNVLGAPQPMKGSRGAAARASRLARDGLALVPEDRALWFGLTARQHLRLAARRVPHSAQDAVKVFPALGPLLDRRAGLMSGGEQQMLALARALATQPRLLLIDELSLGLAPIIVQQLLPLVRDLAQTRAIGVLLVEQHVSAALAIADRAYVMARGAIVMAGSAAELAADHDRIRESYLGVGGAPS
jgi:branched-chain amino acid transport system ATP-binding protein